MIPNWAVRELVERLNSSKAQGKIVREYAERYHVSTATVYRKLMKFQGKKSKVRITEEERAAAMLVSGYLQAVMSRKGVAPSTETAIRELARMGKIQSPESRVQSWGKRPKGHEGPKADRGEMGTVPRSARSAVQSPFPGRGVMR